ncbi:MAG TPA: 6-hydroxymethylpterin diphosphokinase MptE-like protein, partial [Pseudodesulfovibrio sp.]|nr:6-hydroxymethylpterin diphosphokinase MptE-like protein [Pseudodesulfovibrio sp.]
PKVDPEPGSLYARKDQFPTKDPLEAWRLNLLVGWQDAGNPVMFAGCYPWLPPGFDIWKDITKMVPDREAICNANRERHLKSGIELSVQSFLPGGPMEAVFKGRPVIVCGSGPSLGKKLEWIKKARELGAAVLCINGAIAAVPDADAFFALERCSKPVWWKDVDTRRVPIWTSPSAARQIANDWPATMRYYFLHHWDVYDGWHEAPARLHHLLPTLSCMISSSNCLQLLAWCKPSAIGLVGQDLSGGLSLDPLTGTVNDKGYYWDGSYPPALQGEPATLDVGVDGQAVVSSSRMDIMAKAMSLSGQLIAHNADIPVVNLGGTGILDLPVKGSPDDWQWFCQQKG